LQNSKNHCIQREGIMLRQIEKKADVIDGSSKNPDWRKTFGFKSTAPVSNFNANV